MSDRAVLDLAKRPAAACNLVCFPFAGGGPGMFRSWVADVPPWVGVWSAHLAGREGRFDRPPRNDLKEQVMELVDAVQPLLDRPIVFYGHSLGATLAAHVAQELFPCADVACSLIVGARRSPWLPPYEGWDVIDFSTVSDRELIQAYVDLGATPPEVLGNQELLDILMPVIRADAELAQAASFIREGVLSVPVHAWYGRDDTCVGAEPLGAWRRITTGPFTLAEITGDHFFLNTHRTLVQDHVLPVLLSTIRRRRIPS
ncbi:alpha/beta fold hydrolase [Streptomyces sp. SID685]|uniref:thioesterase domain-containing protein n=1 Tax=Streptomyces TaxID=1883 RepID=UPI00136F711E|nr:alpha/beta fold hydrolase [Streptomyces sp. SID685]